jgi:hypothetical protein
MIGRCGTALTLGESGRWGIGKHPVKNAEHAKRMDRIQSVMIWGMIIARVLESRNMPMANL